MYGVLGKGLDETFFYLENFKKVKMVIIIGVMKPHVDDILVFHPNMDIFILEQKVSSAFWC